MPRFDPHERRDAPVAEARFSLRAAVHESADRRQFDGYGYGAFDGFQAVVRGTVSSRGGIIDRVIASQALYAILDQGALLRLHPLKIPIFGGLVLRADRAGKEQVKRQQQARKPQKFIAANDRHGPVLMRWKR